jgi:hypothetical protein
MGYGSFLKMESTRLNTAVTKTQVRSGYRGFVLGGVP